MQTVLAISLGTCWPGTAIFVNGELRDWQIKNFKGPWSPHKKQVILNSLQRIIETHKITIVAMKIPRQASITAGLRDLIQSFKALCNEQEIPCHCYTLKSIKQILGFSEQANNQILILRITSQFPEILHLFHTRSKQTPYYLKLFEAIYTGSCFLQDSQKEITN